MSDDVRVVCRLCGSETFWFTFEVESMQSLEETYRLKLLLGNGLDVVTPWTPYDKMMWMEIHGRLFVCVSAYYLDDEVGNGFRMLHPMEAIKVVGSGVVVR